MSNNRLLRREQVQRDLLICTLYVEGNTQEELANRFDITTARVGQILQSKGLRKADREVVLNGPTVFTGVLLPRAVKEAVKVEAKGEEMSMSAFIAKCVIEELKRRNINIEEEPIQLSTEVEVPLPLEG